MSIYIVSARLWLLDKTAPIPIANHNGGGGGGFFLAFEDFLVRFLMNQSETSLRTPFHFLSQDQSTVVQRAHCCRTFPDDNHQSITIKCLFTQHEPGHDCLTRLAQHLLPITVKCLHVQSVGLLAYDSG